MKRATPIRFRDPNLSDEMRERISVFMDTHPIATSSMSALLGLIALGGLLTAAVVVPGALKVWGGYVAKRRREKAARYQYLWQSFYRLRRDRVIQYVCEKDGEDIYEVTEKGRKRLHVFAMETLSLKTPKRWDEQWRLILFDIPEHHRVARRTFQEKLRGLGCYPFQKSAWVYPFPCGEEIGMLADFLGVAPYVHTLTVTELPSGKPLYHFRNIIKRAA